MKRRSYTFYVPSLHIIYGSTSGHTEYVVDIALSVWKKMKGLTLEVQRAEEAEPKDLLRGDIVILGSGSWNTGSVEGQLNPYMHRLLKDHAKDIDLQKQKIGLIGLGDERYHFTLGCLTHFRKFIAQHNATLVEPILKIVNEPYGQEDHIKKWAKDFAALHLSKTSRRKKASSIKR